MLVTADGRSAGVFDRAVHRTHARRPGRTRAEGATHRRRARRNRVRDAGDRTRCRARAAARLEPERRDDDRGGRRAARLPAGRTGRRSNQLFGCDLDRAVERRRRRAHARAEHARADRRSTPSSTTPRKRGSTTTRPSSATRTRSSSTGATPCSKCCRPRCRADRVQAALARIDTSITGFSSAVTVDAKRVTLTARKANIPLSFENQLEAARTINVRVHLESPKLTFPEGADQVVALGPGTYDRACSRSKHAARARSR